MIVDGADCRVVFVEGIAAGNFVDAVGVYSIDRNHRVEPIVLDCMDFDTQIEAVVGIPKLVVIDMNAFAADVQFAR